MKIGLISVCLLACLAVRAQKKIEGNAKWKFHSLNQFALLNGENAVSGGIQSINGLGNHNWYVGLGAGIDYYLFRSVPLFIDLRKSFGAGARQFFVYTDLGWNLSWVKEELNNNWIWGWPVPQGEDFSNGAYADAGFGYAIGMKHDNALLVSLGYSYKGQESTAQIQDWRTGEMLTQRKEYNLNRLVLKLGWKF